MENLQWIELMVDGIDVQIGHVEQKTAIVFLRELAKERSFVERILRESNGLGDVFQDERSSDFIAGHPNIPLQASQRFLGLG